MAEDDVCFVHPSGYGFITRESGDDVFFHQSQVSEDLAEGETVIFTVEASGDGPKAANLRRVGQDALEALNE